MVSLSPVHRSLLRESATNALSAFFNEAQDDMPSKSKAGQGLPALVEAVAAAVQSVVSEACADFKEQWNVSHPDTIMRLPVELFGHFFAPLESFAERTFISHVSRAWRRVALAHRSMWTDVTVTEATFHKLTKLSTLFSRSYPLPCRVSWYAEDTSANDSRDIVAFLARNEDRIQSLTIYGAPYAVLLDVLSHPAPSLQQMTFRNSKRDIWSLPRHWQALSAAPCLRELTLGAFSIPPIYAPLPAVRAFRGYRSFDYDTGVDNLQNIFNVFPGLTSLELNELTVEALSVLPVVPPTVTHIVLTPVSGFVDYSTFVETRLTHNIPSFRVRRADNIPATIDAFAAKVRGTWSMITGDSSVVLEASGTLYEIYSPGTGWWVSNRSNFMRRLDGLVVLALPLGALVDLVSGISWGRHLPALRTLRLEVGVWDMENARALAAEPCPACPVRAPQLEHLTVAFAEGDADFVAIVLPPVMAMLVSRHDSVGGLLEDFTLEVQVRRVTPLRDCDLSALAKLAKRVLVREDRSLAVFAEFLKGGFLCGPQLRPS